MPEHLKKHQFKKGQSGNPHGVPVLVKKIREGAIYSFWNTFKRLGGEEGLYEWANRNSQNKRIFYSWLVALAPKEAKFEGMGGTKIIILREREKDKPGSDSRQVGDNSRIVPDGLPQG